MFLELLVQFCLLVSYHIYYTQKVGVIKYKFLSLFCFQLKMSFVYLYSLSVLFLCQSEVFLFTMSRLFSEFISLVVFSSFFIYFTLPVFQSILFFVLKIYLAVLLHVELIGLGLCKQAGRQRKTYGYFFLAEFFLTATKMRIINQLHFHSLTMH